MNFITSSPITYEVAVVNRKEAPDKISLSGRLGREISNVIEKNKTFFDNDIKKAWFIIGQIYKNTIDASKKYYKYANKEMDDKNQGYESSHLEKNFFYSRKFDSKTFVLFANTCSEKLQKYNAYYDRIKNDMSEAKEYMASNQNEKLNNDEAKYIFFWGLDTIFEDDKKRMEEAKAKKEAKEK